MDSDGKRAVFDGDCWVGKAEEEVDNELEWEKCGCCLAEDACEGGVFQQQYAR